METRPGIYTTMAKAGVALGFVGVALWLISYKV